MLGLLSLGTAAALEKVFLWDQISHSEPKPAGPSPVAAEPTILVAVTDAALDSRGLLGRESEA